ncbi:MAG: hypothetical protein JNK82_35170 [Myxococcaceae bacterium]|nr:hypothetical protein [Myxococcaceae bacterium]
MRQLARLVSCLVLVGACAGGGEGGTGGGSGTAGGNGTAGGTAGGEGGTSGGMEPAYPLDMFCSERANAVCGRQVRCGQTLAAQRASCVDRYTSGCSGVHAPVARVQRGLDTFYAQRARPCIEAYATFTCEAGSGVDPPECRDLFAVDAGVGAPCFSDDHCRQGFCSVTGAVTCGTCTQFTPPGQPCGGAARCDPAVAVCPPALADGGLADGGGTPRCVAYLADGQTCTNNRDCLSRGCTRPLDGGVTGVCGFEATGAPCDTWAETALCAPTEYCRGLRYRLNTATQQSTRITAGACTPRRALGAPCVVEQLDDSCAPAGVCLGGTCKPVGLWAQPYDADCQEHSDCVGGRCVLPPWPRIYQQFFADGGPRDVPGKCEELSDAGEACGGLNPCTPTHYCPSSGITRCAPKGAVGATCANFTQCLNLLSCVATDAGSSTCQPGAPLGATCNTATSGPCESQLCQIDGGSGASPGTCIAPGAVGAVCYRSSECATANCRKPDGGLVHLGDPGRCEAPCW